MSQEFNEMEHLERQIIKRYNELIKDLIGRGRYGYAGKSHNR